MAPRRKSPAPEAQLALIPGLPAASDPAASRPALASAVEPGGTRAVGPGGTRSIGAVGPGGTRSFGAPELLRPSGPPVCGELEELAASRGWTLLIGLDEAGRGPLAGPVVAAACSLPPACLAEARALGLDDSKRLDEAAREALYGWITAHARGWAAAVVDAETIDAMNILRASLHAMRLAWDSVVAADPALRPAHVFVDGRDRAPLPEDVWQQPLIKGDGRSLQVAAASILAKVTRDRWMDEAHARFPHYGFHRHRGYPTPAHRAAIAAHGPCPLHRRSFTLLPAEPTHGG